MQGKGICSHPHKERHRLCAAWWFVQRQMARQQGMLVVTPPWLLWLDHVRVGAMQALVNVCDPDAKL
tara:strand:+ start:117 stop:317 length:201 start_codon:yes stop_codon:yes gene_type:complete